MVGAFHWRRYDLYEEQRWLAVTLNPDMGSRQATVRKGMTLSPAPHTAPDSHLVPYSRQVKGC